jgi:putative ATP-binding cassette transporter
MRVLWRFFRTFWLRLLLAGMTGLVAGLSSAGLLAFINHALQADHMALPPEDMAGIFGGLCALVFLSGVLSDSLLIKLGQERVFRLRLELSQRILAAPLRQLQILGRHRLLAVLTDDIGYISTAYQVVPMLCINGAMIIGCLGYLWWLDRQIFLLALAFIVVGVGSFRLLEERALRWLRHARRGSDTLYRHFGALTEGTKELKMHSRRRQAFLQDELRGTADSIRRHLNKGQFVYTVANHWGNMLFYAVIGLLLFGLPHWRSVEPEALTGYVLAILYLTRPMGEVLSALPILGRGSVALQNIENLGLSLAEQSREAEARAAAPAAKLPGRLELSGVTHCYRHERDDSCFTLGPIDWVLNPGELIFVVGGNGSGKTTLAMLLLGLYTPEQGSIRLDGAAISDANRDVYRQQFAAVFADAYVFQTLLGYGADGLDAMALKLLKELQLDHKVRVEEGRFSTVDLSQGQRKRLALLSAWLDDRPFCLFDEWAADQDPVFKAVFYTQLLPLLKARGKTVVAITHDAQYFHLADRLVRLDSGQIIEDLPTREWQATHG